MAKSAGQKLKLLYLLELLERESCEETPISTAKMISYLESKGIHSERKSIYDDMESLRDFGYDILQNSSRNGGGYYLGTREFELPELKLMVDAVQSSRFITTRKTRELISKLEKKAGQHDAGQLQRDVYVVGRVKTENENIYYSIDTIHRAIQEQRRITFDYLDWNADKELTVRTGGRKCVTPWALFWKDENYYLVGIDNNDPQLTRKHYRVDKMGNTELGEPAGEEKKLVEKLNPADYTTQIFGMFAGEEETVTLQLPESKTGIVVDRFGKEASLRKGENGTILVRVKVAVSNQFFGWLAGIGKDAVIVKPESTRQKYAAWLQEILDGYVK